MALLTSNLLLSVVYGQTTTTYFYDNISGNWSNNGISGDYRADLGLKSWKFTRVSGFTGDNFYKIYDQSNNSNGNFNSPSGSKVWSGILSVNTIGTAFAYGDGEGGAGYFSVTSGKYYTYIWEDVNTSSNAQAIVMETSDQPVTITNVTGDYLNPGTAMTVTATLSAAKSAEENIFIRYTTNSFSTSSFVLMTCSGTSCTGTIPAGDVGSSADHQLYILSTTLGNGSITHSNADLVTINFNNNSNSNYQMSILPISLTHFSATPKSDRIELSWATASEQNNDYMAVERSAEGSRWQELGRVAGAGTTTQPQAYTLTDEKPLPGLNYYRLRQVDYDGAVEYHKTIVVDFKSATGGLHLFPSPAQERLNVALPAPAAQDSELWLLDTQGRVLQRIVIPQGGTQGAFQVAALPEGVYFVRMAGDVRSFRFVR